MSLKGVARLLRGVNRDDRPVLSVRPVAVRLVTDRNVATDRRPLLCGVATGVTYNGMSECIVSCRALRNLGAEFV